MFKKRFERKLDKYYTKKLINNLSANIDVYGVHKRIIFHKNTFEIEIKHRKYDDKFYKSILNLPCNESFFVLTNKYEECKNNVIYFVKKNLETYKEE